MVLALMLSLTVFRLTGLFTEPRLSAKEIHALAGQRSRVPWTRVDDRPTRIVAWNIERGVKFDEIEARLRELDADLVLLQEVDRLCARSDSRDVAYDLAIDLGMNWISAGEFEEIGEGHDTLACVSGQAILSRAPIDEAFVVVLREQAPLKGKRNPAAPRRGGRIALGASIDGVSVYNLHLDSGSNEQRRARQLTEIVAHASKRTGPVLIGGDFNNESTRESAMFSGLGAAGFVNTMAAAAPPARRPIDWIFTRNLGGTSARTPAPDASDHDPMILVSPAPLRDQK